MSNLKQIGLSFMFYLQDYDEYFPHYTDGTAEWYRYIRMYMGNAPGSHQVGFVEEVWWCPSAPDKHAGAGGYGYNYVTFHEAPAEHIRLSQVKKPSETLMVCDSVSSVGAVARNVSGDQEVPDRHSGGANVLFVDGHVQWLLKSVIDQADPNIWDLE